MTSIFGESTSKKLLAQLDLTTPSVDYRTVTNQIIEIRDKAFKSITASSKK